MFILGNLPKFKMKKRRSNTLEMKKEAPLTILKIEVKEPTKKVVKTTNEKKVEPVIRCTTKNTTGTFDLKSRPKGRTTIH